MQADVFLTPRTVARATTAAGSTWLTITPDTEDPDRVVLFLGDGQGKGHCEAAKIQLVALIAAARQAAELLGIDLEPEPGPDEPDDEPTDEPVLRADGIMGTDREYAERMALVRDLELPTGHADYLARMAVELLAQRPYAGAALAAQAVRGIVNPTDPEWSYLVAVIGTPTLDDWERAQVHYGPKPSLPGVASPAAPVNSAQCVTCGHGGHDHTPTDPCLACSSSKVPGSCATTAIADAYDRGRLLAARAPWAESELRFAAGDR